MVLKEVANENPIRLQRRLPGQRDSVPLYICDPEIMIFLWDSLWGFEVDGMTAWAVAPPVEGHDDEAVLGEGRQNWYRGVVLIPGDCQRVFISGTFL